MRNDSNGGEIEFRKSMFSGWNECVEVALVDNGAMVRDSKHRNGTVLQFTHGEWDAFVKGVRAGEFG
jgi:Domain of unknown function (DUF397)